MDVYIVVSKIDGMSANCGVFTEYDKAESFVLKARQENPTYSYDVEHWIDGKYSGGGYWNPLHAKPGQFCHECGETHCLPGMGHSYDDNGFCQHCGADGNA